MSVSAADKRVVCERAGGHCEYCRMPEAREPFFAYHVEHIIARRPLECCGNHCEEAPRKGR